MIFINTNPQRTGFLTSEFISTILALIIGGLVASGKVTPAAGNSLVEFAGQVIGAIVALTAAVAYNDGRVELKKSILKNQIVITGNSALPVDAPIPAV